MELNRLLLNREDWQRNAFDTIKNSLIYSEAARSVRYENTKEDHLVVIYGKSQVGKTTLILNMIGLKQEYLHEVYDTLRAGVARGNSSTSTAIIYAKSVNGQYGCSLSSTNDISLKDINYCDKEGMINYLKEMREQVENNRVSQDRILYIYIPKDYFVDDNTTNSISILDMPGVESRNHKEDIHVASLMKKYIPVSSVCIVACRANEIQSLENLELPGVNDWKRMNHRFVLVVTHAYNDGITKQYFYTDPSQRTQKFYDYVKGSYTDEIRKILGSDNQTEIYPVDVGDSLKKLCKEEIKRDADRNETEETKDNILKDLRESIVRRKGQRLESAIKDLNVLIENSFEYKKNRIEKEISDLNAESEHKKNLIKKSNKDIETLRNELNEQQEEINETDKLLSNYLLSYSWLKKIQCVPGLPENVKKFISENSLYGFFRADVLSDYDEEVLKFIIKKANDGIDNVVSRINKILDSGHSSGNSECSISLDKNKIKKIKKNAVDIILKQKDKMYPPKKALFQKREKVTLEEVNEICIQIQNDINRLIKKQVKDYCIRVINAELSKQKKEKRKSEALIEKLIEKEKKKIEQYTQEIVEFTESLNNLTGEKNDLLQQQSQDRKTFELYLQYAKDAYFEQKNNVIMQMNKAENPHDKLLLILFLGILERDYNNIIR